MGFSQKWMEKSMIKQLVALCALTAAMAFASAQSITAGATKPAPISGTNDQIAVLRQQVIVLSGRVLELEKKADQANNSDDDVQSKQIEQRLGAVERAQAKLQEAEKTDASPASNDGSASHAKAPFVVYDDQGHAIFRVEVGMKTGMPRMIVGNELSAHAVLGANNNIGSAGLQLYGADDNGSIQLAGGKQTYLKVGTPVDKQSITISPASLIATSKDLAQQALLGLTAEGNYGLFISRGNTGSVVLQTSSTGAGYLSLSNKQNEVVAEGGSKPNGVGIFRTGPSCCKAPGAVGPHQYIVGKEE
jgi:hypothetical protein